MVSPGSYRAGRMFCRDGYDWCWDSDRRGGNRVRRADPGPVSTGCSRTGRPVVYKPMLVPEDLAFVPSRRCTVWVWVFLHLPILSCLGSATFLWGEVML